MKIPLFEEIKTRAFDQKTLIDLLKMHGAGSRPVYIVIDSNDQSEVLNKIDNLLDALNYLKINPFLPYGVYVVTSVIEQHEQINVVSSVLLLPRHFMKKVKRLKNKESNLLNRVGILSDKVKNFDLEKFSDDLKYQMVAHKELYKLCDEIEFYEGVAMAIDKEKIKG